MLHEAKNAIEERFRKRGTRVLEWIEEPSFGSDRHGSLIQAKIRYAVSDGAEFTCRIIYRLRSGKIQFLTVDHNQLTGVPLQPMLDCLDEFPEEEEE